MQFGAHLPSYWDDYGSSNPRIAIEEAAKAAEALGYAGVWANDLVVAPPQLGWGQIIEPLVTLATLVNLVPKLKFGTSVLILPQRNSMLVAKQVAALDLLSQGRLILGVGVGWRKDEFKLLNADFANRAAVTDEAIEVLQTLWREPTAHYHGHFHHFDNAIMMPKPAGDGPPIWIGGNSMAAIRRTAKYGRAWLPYVIDLDSFRSGVASLRELTEGHEYPLMAAQFNLRIEKPSESSAVQTKSPWTQMSITGSAEAVVELLRQYEQAGLEYALISFESESVDDLLRQMRVFAEDVVPHFANARSS
jgi:probable F420-dependent oxidoreductase